MYYLNCTCMVTIRLAAPWFSEDIKLERRIRRRLKRKWRRSGLPGDGIRFIEQNCIVNQLLFSACSQYYSKLIDENCLSQRKSFGIVSKLLLRNPAPLYPSCCSMVDLPNNFIDFFAHKITTIRHELKQILSRVFIHLKKIQSQQQKSIVSAILYIQLYLRFCIP